MTECGIAYVDTKEQRMKQDFNQSLDILSISKVICSR